MKVPNSVHEAHPWAISQIAPDFKLLDVWALPIHGGRDEFPRVLEALGSFDPTSEGPAISRVLFWVRLRLGQLLGWDDATKARSIPGSSEASLRARLPEHLRDTARNAFIGQALRGAAGGFSPLYQTEYDAAAEISNDTVHGVLHLAWVEQDDGCFRAHMAVYVKPRGRLGEVYMKLIEPFRYLIVYPALIRELGRAWDARDRGRS